MTPEAKQDILKSCPSLGEAVNKAALHLPEGWLVRIIVEKHGYCVDLVNYPKGEK